MFLKFYRDFSMTPHLLEERRQMIHDFGATVLVDLSRDCVRSGPAGELLHGPDGFAEGERTRSALVSTYGRRTMATSSSIRCGRVSLDLLGLVSSPSVLHLVQPLLRKAVTTAEGCSVVVGRVVDVGFMQAVLLDEQVADGGVAVIEPFLMLAMCATEDNQGRRLDCVPQLAPSVLHGGLLVGGGVSEWKVG
ncbi:hypothetical protein SprV_0100386500 [Sparganum proliferum]